jgi:hypothetical protein
MNEHLVKANDDLSFICDDLAAAHAEADPVLALILNDLLNRAVSLRGRLGQVIEAVQAEEKRGEK